MKARTMALCVGTGLILGTLAYKSPINQPRAGMSSADAQQTLTTLMKAKLTGCQKGPRKFGQCDKW